MNRIQLVRIKIFLMAFTGSIFLFASFQNCSRSKFEAYDSTKKNISTPLEVYDQDAIDCKILESTGLTVDRACNCSSQEFSQTGPGTVIGTYLYKTPGTDFCAAAKQLGLFDGINKVTIYPMVGPQCKHFIGQTSLGITSISLLPVPENDADTFYLRSNRGDNVCSQSQAANDDVTCPDGPQTWGNGACHGNLTEMKAADGFISAAALDDNNDEDNTSAVGSTYFKCQRFNPTSNLGRWSLVADDPNHKSVCTTNPPAPKCNENYAIISNFNELMTSTLCTDGVFKDVQITSIGANTWSWNCYGQGSHSSEAVNCTARQTTNPIACTAPAGSYCSPSTPNIITTCTTGICPAAGGDSQIPCATGTTPNSSHTACIATNCIAPEGKYCPTGTTTSTDCHSGMKCTGGVESPCGSGKLCIAGIESNCSALSSCQNGIATLCTNGMTPNTTQTACGTTPIAGLCNVATALGCAQGDGYVLSDNDGGPTCGQTRYWTCRGSNNGSQSGVCSKFNGACGSWTPSTSCNGTTTLTTTYTCTGGNGTCDQSAPPATTTDPNNVAICGYQVYCPALTETLTSVANNIGATQSCSVTLPRSTPGTITASVTNGGSYTSSCNANGVWSTLTTSCPPPANATAVLAAGATTSVAIQTNFGSVTFDCAVYAEPSVPGGLYIRCRGDVASTLGRAFGQNYSFPQTLAIPAWNKNLNLNFLFFGTSNNDQQAYSDSNCATIKSYYLGSSTSTMPASGTVPNCKGPNNQCVDTTTCRLLPNNYYGGTATYYKMNTIGWSSVSVTYENISR